jgi:hypothetical protein
MLCLKKHILYILSFQIGKTELLCAEIHVQGVRIKLRNDCHKSWFSVYFLGRKVMLWLERISWWEGETWRAASSQRCGTEHSRKRGQQVQRPIGRNKHSTQRATKVTEASWVRRDEIRDVDGQDLDLAEPCLDFTPGQRWERRTLMGAPGEHTCARRRWHNREDLRGEGAWLDFRAISNSQMQGWREGWGLE